MNGRDFIDMLPTPITKMGRYIWTGRVEQHQLAIIQDELKAIRHLLQTIADNTAPVKTTITNVSGYTPISDGREPLPPPKSE